MPKYGSVIEINREDYIEEVTKASNEVFVVLHMYQDYIEECVLINQLLNEIAKEKPTVKFVKIVATVIFHLNNVLF
jgi:thioredoxin-like negative regulator of GroEL